MVITSDYYHKSSMKSKFTILNVGDIHTELINKIDNLYNDSCLIICANNEDMAINYLYNLSIDLILINIMNKPEDTLNLLCKFKNNCILSKIPVLVVTEDSNDVHIDKALKYGAHDVISISISDNILKKRISNTLALNNVEKPISSNEISFDAVTGLLNRFSFINKLHNFVSNYPANSFILYAVDIDGFKLINDRCGHAEGNRLLCFIAELHKKNKLIPNSLICRDMGDVFFSIAPYDKNDLDKNEIKQFFDSIESYDLPIGVNVHIGKYVIDDPTLDVNLMMDRALIAVRTIKGSASKRAVFFSEDMRKKLLFRQEIENDMRSALIDKQFVLYFQPQYNYETKKMTGAEVLVRWLHPTKGILYPNEFIPLFEKNGFITELDLYIWEQACIQLRTWTDEGIAPASISVNISRQDINTLDITKVIPKLTEKYCLLPSQLHLEITESAYIETPEKLINVVTTLQSLGYTIEMDDFGTGYSSINILKEVPVDILKLDIRSIIENGNSTRSGNILSSVIRMAHWLNLPVIAEGVETKEQAEYLKSMNCLLMQGYYFNKPMPVVNDFINLLHNQRFAVEPYRIIGTNSSDATNFLDASTQTTLLFNDFVGSAYIAEYDGENYEMLRANDSFLELAGVSRQEYTPYMTNFLSRLEPNEKNRLKNALTQAILTGKEIPCELFSQGIPNIGIKPIRMTKRIRFLARNADKYLFYVAVEDVTERVELEEQNQKLSDELIGIFSNMPTIIIKAEYKNQTLDIKFVSDCIVNILGYTSKEFISQLNQDFLFGIHPDDRERIHQSSIISRDNLISFSEDYRMKKKDGQYIWINFICNASESETGVVNIYGSYADITERKKAEAKIAYRNDCLNKMDKALSAATIINNLGMENELLFVSESIETLIGYTQEEFEKMYINAYKDIIYPDDYEKVYSLTMEYAISRPVNYEIEFRMICKNGNILWIAQKATYLSNFNGKPAYMSVFMDISKHVKAIKENEQILRIMSKHSQKYLVLYDFATDSINPLGKNINVKNNVLEILPTAQDYFDHGIFDPEYVEPLINIYKLMRSGVGDVTECFRAKSKSGKWVWMELTISSVYDNNGKPSYAIASFEDITERYEKERSLLIRAQSDSVTGVFNRSAFVEKVENKLEEADENCCAFIMMDIDNFKRVNDTLGHIEGDKLLHEIANTVKSRLKKEDIVGRIGGDEFGIFLSGFSDENELMTDLNILIKSIYRKVAEKVTVSASIGASIYPKDGCSFEELYEKADIALYEVKESGRNKCMFYEPEDNSVLINKSLK